MFSGLLIILVPLIVALPYSTSAYGRIKTHQSSVELDRLPYSLFYGHQPGVSG